MLKSLVILAPVLGAAAWFGGVFDSSYDRVVDRPPAEVISALSDFQMASMEGQPGSDPSLSGGVQSLFRTERTGTGWAYVIRSGNDVATTMFVDVKDLGDGRSKVVARVERGNAPDDFTAPAFRSESTTMMLFSMALEDELNRLTLPALANPAVCEQILERFAQDNRQNGFRRPETLSEGMGQTARAGIALSAVEAELRRNGCDTTHSEFREAPVQTSSGLSPAAKGFPPPAYGAKGGHDAVLAEQTRSAEADAAMREMRGVRPPSGY